MYTRVLGYLVVFDNWSDGVRGLFLSLVEIPLEDFSIFGRPFLANLFEYFLTRAHT